MKKEKNYNQLNLDAITKGDFNAILKINSRYINTVANQYAGSDNFLFEEYQQLIRISLFKAFKSYLSTENSSFIKYAQRIILNDLRAYYYKNDLLKMGRKDKKDKVIQDVVDIQMPIDNEDGVLLIDTIIIPEEKQLDMSSVIEAIKTLKPVYQEIIINHHGLNGKKPRTFIDMGMEYGMTHQSVYDKYARAMKQLKQNKRLVITFKRDNEH